MYYLNIFFIYSFIGYVLEYFICNLFGRVYNSGFIYGPLTPVYGIGMIFIIFNHKLLNKTIINKPTKIIFHFFLNMIVLTTLEFIAGNLIYHLTGDIYWNYSDLKYNLGYFISLEVALIWGVASTLVFYLFNPIINKISKIIPKYLTIILTALYSIDIVISLILKL